MDKITVKSKIRCMIVEDEPLSIEIIEKYIGKIPGLDIIATCDNALDAIKILKEKEVDVVFLDINMPSVSGLQMARSLVNPPLIIFTTAYPEYAVDGFDLDATDYLLKPFSFERFLKAVDKVYYRTGSKSEKEFLEADFIMIRADKKDYKVDLSNILFIQSKGDYLKIKTRDLSLITLDTLTHLLQKLPDNQFVRIHKSYIASLDKIDYIEGNYLLIGGDSLPIGQVYKDQLLNLLI